MRFGLLMIGRGEGWDFDDFVLNMFVSRYLNF